MDSKHMKGEYTAQEVIDSFLSEKTEDVYRRKEVVYRGAVKDSNKLYSDLLAEVILNKYQTMTEKDFERFLIPQDNMVDDTYLDSVEHNTKINYTNRNEENLAKKVTDMGLESEDNYKIIYYQFPVNRVHKSSEGKVDLLMKNSNTVAIGELKDEDSTETLLRAVLEIKTYLIKLSNSKTANERLKDTVKGEIEKIIPAVIIASDENSITAAPNSRNQIKVLNRPKYDFENMKEAASRGYYSALYQLCKEWGIEFFEIVINKEKSNNKEYDYDNYDYSLVHLEY